MTQEEQQQCWILEARALLQAEAVTVAALQHHLTTASLHGIEADHPVLDRLQQRIYKQVNWLLEASNLVGRPHCDLGLIKQHLAKAASYRIPPREPLVRSLNLRLANDPIMPELRSSGIKLLKLDLADLPQHKEDIETFVFEADYFEAPQDVMDMAQRLSARLTCVDHLACLLAHGILQV
jgi:hypothetical protein